MAPDVDYITIPFIGIIIYLNSLKVHDFAI